MKEDKKSKRQKTEEKAVEEKVVDKQNREVKPGFFKRYPILTAFLQGLLFFSLIFIVGELGVRHLSKKTLTIPKHEGGTEFKPHPVLFWRLRSNLNMLMKMPKGGEFVVVTNKEGIRNDEIPFKKPSNGYRIECYGDSITYGHGVDKPYTYETQLQTLLRKKYTDKSIDVINFGCPGYTSEQGWYLYNKLGKKYDPDMCILAFCFADPSAEEISDYDRAPKNPIVRGMQELLYQSEFYLALRQAKIDNVNIHGKTDTVSLTSVRVSEARYEKLMRAWAASMKKEKGHVVFLGLAMTTPDPFDYYANYRKICKKVAKETGNYYIDMNAAFRDREGQIEDLFLMSVAENELVDRIHPNEKGFAIMADKLADLIEKEKLIK